MNGSPVQVCKEGSRREIREQRIRMNGSQVHVCKERSKRTTQEDQQERIKQKGLEKVDQGY